MAFVEFKNVYKRYKMGDVTINASDGVSFEINKGEFVVIVGASGGISDIPVNVFSYVQDIIFHKSIKFKWILPLSFVANKKNTAGLPCFTQKI